MAEAPQKADHGRPTSWAMTDRSLKLSQCLAAWVVSTLYPTCLIRGGVLCLSCRHCRLGFDPPKRRRANRSPRLLAKAYLRATGGHRLRGRAGRLYDRLITKFAPATIFMDVGSIRGGDNFEVELHHALDSCGVAIALIGFDWLDRSPRSNISDIDYVRMEIEGLLSRNIPVMPAQLMVRRCRDRATSARVASHIAAKCHASKSSHLQ